MSFAEKLAANIPYDTVFAGFIEITWKQVVMWFIGFVLISLAIRFRLMPSFLLPVGFGTILANMPGGSVVSVVVGEEGFLNVLYTAGVTNPVFPVMLLIASGTLCDFSGLIRRPMLLLLAAAGPIGMFATSVFASCLGFTLEQSVAVGIAGAADGPTTIYVASRLAPGILPLLAVTSFMTIALAPVIQPPIIDLLTSPEERKIRVAQIHTAVISKPARLAFPLLTAILAGLAAPQSVVLVGSLMFGVLIKESGCLERLSQSAGTVFANLVLLLLGISIGGAMDGESFLHVRTVYIFCLGGLSLVLSTMASVLFAKVINRFCRNKINPVFGACFAASVPTAERTVAKMFGREYPERDIAQLVISINGAGQFIFLVSGGIVLNLVPLLARL